MTLRNKRKPRKSRVESLELRALLSGDGVLPPGLPVEPNDPAVSGPVAPPEPGIFEPVVLAEEIDLDSELGNDIHAGGLDESATLLTFENGFATVSSNIDRDADSDVFRFTAEQELLQIDGLADLPIRISIHDAAGDVVGEGEGLFPEDPAFFGEDLHPFFGFAETTPGDTYFISVGSTKGEVGSYQMNAMFLAPPEPPKPDAPLGEDAHSDSFESATKLDLDEQPFFEVTSNIDSADDADVFQISVPEGQLIVDAWGSDGDVNIDLLAADGRRIPTDEDGSPNSIFHHVDEGNYFIQVTGDVGLYQLFGHSPLIIVDPLPISSGPVEVDSPLGEDAHGDTVAAATELEMDPDAPVTSVASNIDSGSDVDIFAVTSNNRGDEIVFDVVALSDGLSLDVQVVSPEGEINEIDINGFSPDGMEILPEGGQIVEGFFDPEPNQTYFISIGSAGEGTGAYNLNVFALSDPIVEPLPILIDAPLGEDVHGDTLETATQMDADGHDVWSNIDSETDKDLFFVDGTDRHIFGHISRPEGGELSVRLLDADGNELESEGLFLHDESEIDRSFDGFVEQPFYIEVAGAVGPYSLHVFAEPLHPIDPFPRPVEPEPIVDAPLGEDVHGDDIGSATKTGVNGQFFHFNSNIDTAEDIDVFAIPANELGDEVIFDVSSWDDEVNLSVSVLNSNGQPIEAEGTFEGPFVEGFFDPETDEVHFIAIAGSGPGTYSLNIFIPTAPELPPIVIDPIPVEPVDPTVPFVRPDAKLGDDIHAPDFEDATVVALNEEGFIEISSNIDVQGDVDVFRMTGTGDLMIAEIGGFGATEMLFKVYSEDGSLITEAHAGGILEFETLADDNYFLSAESTGADPGQYFAWLQPITTVVLPDLPPGPPFEGPVEPGLPVDPELPLIPEIPVDTVEPTVEPADPSLVDPEDGEGSKENADQTVSLTSDLDGDGKVNFKDFLILSSNFGKEADAAFADGDINGDGVIDLADFLVLSDEFGGNA